MSRLLLILALGASSAFAQTDPASLVDARGNHVTVISCPDDLIEGSLHKPDEIVLRTPPRHVSKSLITLRKNFRGEILATGSRL